MSVAPFEELGLGNAALTDDQLVDAMMSPLGVKLCRPSEEVLDILPARQRGAFVKEDGEKVVDDAGDKVGR